MNAPLADDNDDLTDGSGDQPAVWSFLRPRGEQPPPMPQPTIRADVAAPPTAPPQTPLPTAPGPTIGPPPPGLSAEPGARAATLGTAEHRESPPLHLVVEPRTAGHGVAGRGVAGRGAAGHGVVDEGFDAGLEDHGASEAAARSPVLVVSSDGDTTIQVVDVLALSGLRSVRCATGEEALRLQEQFSPSVAVVDGDPPDMSAVELQQRLQQLDRQLPLVFLAAPHQASAAAAAAGQLDGVLAKPVAAAALAATVRNAVARRYLAYDYHVVVERLRRLNALQALYDPLTELPNRALLDDRLSQVLAKAQRDGTAVAVLFIDLDGFKVVNDLFGHHVGDKLLTEVGARLAGTRRKSDTVARFGGDEFVVICPDLPSEAVASRIADTILAELTRPVEIEGVEHPLTASIGIMVTDPGAAGQSAETLLRNADAAMYRAKAQGRNRYEVFDQTMHDRAAERFDIERELRLGLTDDELLLAYQAVIDLRTGAPTGFEALLRWRRPGHGTVLPATFLDVAEETGLTVPIGTWVLDRALADLAGWRRRRRLPRHFRLWVNVSPHQLASRQFVDVVEDELTRHGVDPRHVGFEIAEASLRDQGDTMAVLSDLHDLGIALSLDDFGAEHSNFGWLEDLPVAAFKIDRRFVKRLDGVGDRRSSAIVQGLIDLGHALDMTVIAEGVETAVQADRLEAMGCDAAQGYYFGFPTVAAHLWENGDV